MVVWAAFAGIVVPMNSPWTSAVFALGLAACATSPMVTDMPTEPLAPAVATETPAPQAPILISSSADAEPGQRVRFIGVAYDAKLSAIVVSDHFSLYCIELDEWPMEVSGKTVEVIGRLERTDQYAATVNEEGEISQGTSGGDWVLHGVEWRAVE